MRRATMPAAMAAHFTPNAEAAIFTWARAQRAPCTLARIDRDGSDGAGAFRITFTLSAEFPLPRPIADHATGPPPYTSRPAA
jgi:hypothetical protein